jgi:hypothetical protein
LANVIPLPGCKGQQNTPNDSLVAALKDLLSMAEDGSLQSLIGTGFKTDGLRVTIYCDGHDNVYEMLGSIEWLKQEYIDRVLDRQEQ